MQKRIVLVQCGKSQLWRAEHLHSDPDAPKTHCAKSVFSQPLPRDDDGKHCMTGTPSEHTAYQEIRHTLNTDNLGPRQLENMCVATKILDCFASPLLCRSQFTSRSATHKKPSLTLRLTFCATASLLFLPSVGTSQELRLLSVLQRVFSVPPGASCTVGSRKIKLIHTKFFHVIDDDDDDTRRSPSNSRQRRGLTSVSVGVITLRKNLLQLMWLALLASLHVHTVDDIEHGENIGRKKRRLLLLNTTEARKPEETLGSQDTQKGQPKEGNKQSVHISPACKFYPS